ncbi:hypothetical protein PTSG_08412 [Salpingoeca rosetta]|uniref:PX domain-containing protein n=1 Tax=Salpingoeca rosetta (strain ATCC 50818 / BSB-021) TaxID=946362 RepID=F2UJL8_SALR5|nr:uncharacterized protein PTSG_08412 [Salpingoeca rosetta]EGD77317.1 hypothetical protein PTSG_08412 [Salpingoeca rosetta]|eukprot:XP_004990661.1 hypothetical protein PTSG_08412 [Salpingoeca rosetta]
MSLSASAASSSTSSSSSVLVASIPRHRQVVVAKKRPTVFEVVLANKDREWRIERRYSEFHMLYKKLKDHIRVPFHFPRKTVMSNKDPKFIESRQKKLEAWLQALLQQPNILSFAAVAEFLEVPSDVLRRRTSGRLASFKSSSSSMHVSNRGAFSPDARSTGGAGGAYSSTHSSKSVTPLRRSRRNSASSHDIVQQGVLASVSGMAAWGDDHDVDDFVRLYYGDDADPMEDASATSMLDHLRIDPSTRRRTRRPTSQSPVSFQAVAAFKGERTDGSDEPFTFAAGDIITVTAEDTSTGWWVGRVGDGPGGLIPPNYVDPGTVRTASSSADFPRAVAAARRSVAARSAGKRDATGSGNRDGDGTMAEGGGGGGGGDGGGARRGVKAPGESGSRSRDGGRREVSSVSSEPPGKAGSFIGRHHADSTRSVGDVFLRVGGARGRSRMASEQTEDCRRHSSGTAATTTTTTTSASASVSMSSTSSSAAMLGATTSTSTSTSTSGGGGRGGSLDGAHRSVSPSLLQELRRRHQQPTTAPEAEQQDDGLEGGSMEGDVGVVGDASSDGHEGAKTDTGHEAAADMLASPAALHLSSSPSLSSPPGSLGSVHSSRPTAAAVHSPLRFGQTTAAPGNGDDDEDCGGVGGGVVGGSAEDGEVEEEEEGEEEEGDCVDEGAEEQAEGRVHGSGGGGDEDDETVQGGVCMSDGEQVDEDIHGGADADEDGDGDYQERAPSSTA